MGVYLAHIVEKLEDDRCSVLEIKKISTVIDRCDRRPKAAFFQCRNNKIEIQYRLAQP